MSKPFTTSKKPTITRLRKEAEAIAKGTKLGEMKADLKKPLEESVKEHIGKAIDRTDLVEGAVMGGLAYAGYEVFGDWKGALWGPVSLLLAQSPSEIAASAGIIGLASLGFMAGAPWFWKWLQDRWSVQLEEAKDVNQKTMTGEMTEEECILWYKNQGTPPDIAARVCKGLAEYGRQEKRKEEGDYTPPYDPNATFLEDYLVPGLFKYEVWKIYMIFEVISPGNRVLRTYRGIAVTGGEKHKGTVLEGMPKDALIKKIRDYCGLAIIE